MTEVLFPQKVIDPSVTCPNTSSGSIGTKGVYTVIFDDALQVAYKVIGFRNYLQQNVNDPTKPNGHMYSEFHIDSRLKWNPPHDKIAQDTGLIKLPNPGISVWWRAMNLNENERKMSTRYIEVGYPDTNNDAIFQQVVC